MDEPATVSKCRESSGGVECCICLEALAPPESPGGSELKALACEHVFHRACIDEWATRCAECPSCRARVASRRGALAIVGSRHFRDFGLFCRVVDDFCAARSMRPSSVISGGANGADRLAKRYAQERNIKYVEYAAQWKKYGKAAGPKRNTLIVAACDAMVAFPASGGKGTQDSVAKAQKKLSTADICVHPL